MHLTMKPSFAADVFDTAKLRTTEVAKLLSVHRVSVSRWRSGHPVTRLFQTTLTDFHSKVMQAIDNGSLPLPQDIRGRERLPAIARALSL